MNPHRPLVNHSAFVDRSGCHWAGRRVTVVGFGRSGRAATGLLARAGCRVRVTDAHDTPELQAAGAALSQDGLEAVELGRHSERLVAGSELVVVSPGVADTVLPIQWASTHGVPIISEIELAFQFCHASVVAVTGTNGKSSVVTLIAEILQASGRPAIACGNLGVPFSAVVGQLEPDAVSVVEVSSFQLAWCVTFRPKIAVLLNLGTNHLDRHGDRRDYIEMKARLFRRQTPEDWAVLNGRDPDVVALAARVNAQHVWFGANRTNPPHLTLSPQTQAALSENAQAALQVCRLLGVADPLAWQTMRCVRRLEHRMEHVATIRGVTYINDSKSTTPESLTFALQQVRGTAVLILGGRDKGLDFRPLAQLCRQPRIRVVVLIGESRLRLWTLLNGVANVQESATLEEAVQRAATTAVPGDTILFSPACASFDMFQDFEARGRAFKALVRRLAGAGNGSAPHGVNGVNGGSAVPRGQESTLHVALR